MSSAPAVEPFVPSFGGEVLNDLQERLSRSRRPASEAADGWERGVPGRWLDELLADGWPGSFCEYLDLLAQTLREVFRPARGAR